MRRAASWGCCGVAGWTWRGAAGSSRQTTAGWGWRGVVPGVQAAVNWGELCALQRYPVCSGLASFNAYCCCIAMQCWFIRFLGEGRRWTIRAAVDLQVPGGAAWHGLCCYTQRAGCALAKRFTNQPICFSGLPVSKDPTLLNRVTRKSV